MKKQLGWNFCVVLKTFYLVNPDFLTEGSNYGVYVPSVWALCLCRDRSQRKSYKSNKKYGLNPYFERYGQENLTFPDIFPKHQSSSTTRGQPLHVETTISTTKQQFICLWTLSVHGLSALLMLIFSDSVRCLLNVSNIHQIKAKPEWQY